MLITNQVVTRKVGFNKAASLEAVTIALRPCFVAEQTRRAATVVVLSANRRHP